MLDYPLDYSYTSKSTLGYTKVHLFHTIPFYVISASTSGYTRTHMRHVYCKLKLMAHSHCTGPGPGPGTGTVCTHCSTGNGVRKGRNLLSGTKPGDEMGLIPSSCAVCTVHSIIYNSIIPSPVPVPGPVQRERAISANDYPIVNIRWLQSTSMVYYIVYLWRTTKCLCGVLLTA